MAQRSGAHPYSALTPSSGLNGEGLKRDRNGTTVGCGATNSSQGTIFFHYLCARVRVHWKDQDNIIFKGNRQLVGSLSMNGGVELVGVKESDGSTECKMRA
jgi:hypothetical protein